MAENQTPEPEDISGGAQMINQGSTDIDNFLPFGGKNPMGNVTPVYKSSPLRQAYPEVKSLDNTTYPIKDNVTGLAPYTNKPNQTGLMSAKDKASADFASVNKSLQSLEDNNSYAKIQAYDSSAAGAHRARYKAYGQETFDRIGFNPEINNEALFNAGTTGLDDTARWLTSAAWPLFSRGFIANPKSYGGIFTGDFGQDIEEAKAYEEYNAIGYSSKGGMGAFMTNTLNSFSYTAGIILEAITEEAIIGGVIGAAGGPQGAAGGTFVGGAIGAIKGLAAVPKALFQMGRQGATLAANLRRLDEMSEARRLYNEASKTVGNFFNPFDNTTNAVSAALNNANNVTRLARATNTFGGFYNDVKNINMALSEGRLEGGFVENNTYKEMYDAHYAKFGVAPDDQKQREFRDVARKAGSDATLYNTMLINYSNKLVIPNVMKGGVFRGLAGYTDDIADFGTHSIILNPKKGFELVKNNFVNSLKALKSPGTYGKFAMSYFKRNVTEGVQENAQDVISDYLQKSYIAAYNDPAKANFDYSKAILKTAIGKQFSAEGLETFASGFAMGALAGPLNALPKYMQIGYNKYYKYAGEYDKYVEGRGQSGKELVDTLNTIYKDPKEFFKHRYFNYGTQSLAAKVADDNTSTAAEYMDQRDAAFISQMQTVLSTGTMKYFVDQIKSYQQMAPKDVEDALGLADGEGAKAIQRVDTIVGRAKRMERRYNYINKKVGKNPIDLALFDKDSDDYNKAALLHGAWEVGVNAQLFMGESFDRNLERIATITDTFGQISQFSNIPSSAIMPLVDKQRLANEFELLQSEISVLEGGGDKASKELNKKKQQLEDLTSFQKALSAVQITVIEKKGIQMLKQELMDSGLPEDKAQLEATKRFEEEFDVLATDLINDLKEVTTQYLLNLSGSNVEFTKLMNKLQEEGDIEGIDYAMTQLIDLHKLDHENQALVKYINVLQDPVEFAIHVNRNLDWMTEMYNNKTEYFKDMVNNTIEQKEYNDLLQALADKGIYVDLNEFADWIEDKTKLPTQFEDVVNKRVIKQGSVLYNQYAELFLKLADIQSKKPAGNKATVDEQLKEELDKAEEEKAAKLAKAKVDYDDKLKAAIGYTEAEYAALKKDEATPEVSAELQERLDALTNLKERLDDNAVKTDEDIDNLLETIATELKDLELLEVYNINVLALSKDRAGKKKAKEYNKETPQEFFDEKTKSSDVQEKQNFYSAYYGRYVASTLLAKEIKSIEDEIGKATPEGDTTEDIVIKEQPAYIDYQQIVANINADYEKIFADILAKYKEKGAKATSVTDARTGQPAKPAVTVDTPWDSLPKELQDELQPLFDAYAKKRKYANEDAATKAKIRENWLKTPEAQTVVKEYANSQIGAEEEVEFIMEEAPTLRMLKRTSEELSESTFEQLQKDVDALQILVNKKAIYNKKTNKDVTLTKKELAFAIEDLKNLRGYLAFRRSVTPIKPEAERIAQVLKKNVLDRQGEVTVFKDSEGNTTGRRLEGIDYEDGEYAARVTQEVDEVLKDINPDYEEYLYSGLKPKVDPKTGRIQPSTVDRLLSELDLYIKDGAEKTLEQKVTKLTDLLQSYFKQGTLKRFGSEKKLKMMQEIFIPVQKGKKKVTGKEFTNANIKAAINELADIGSAIAGSTVDKLGRDFFMDERLTKPDNMSPEAFKSLLEILNRFANQIRDNNMVVISENMLVFDKDYVTKDGKKRGLVGEMDLLGFKVDGKFVIIDMKTGTKNRWDNFNPPPSIEVDLLAKATFAKGIPISKDIIDWKKTGYDSFEDAEERLGGVDGILLKESYGASKRGVVTGLVTLEGVDESRDVEVVFNTDKYTAKGAEDKYSKRPNYSIQQTFYRNSFNNMSGEMPEGIFLLPFEVELEGEDGYIKSLKLPAIADKETMLIELEPVEEVNNYLPLKTMAPVEGGEGKGSTKKSKKKKTAAGTTQDVETRGRITDIITSQLDLGVELPEILEKLAEQGYVEKINGNSFFEQTAGRDAIVFNIDGAIVPVYRSSKGTSSKTKGEWYPFFFNGGDWLVKAGADTYKDGYNNPIIKQILDALNKNYKYAKPLAKAEGNNEELLSLLPLGGLDLDVSFEDNSGIYDFQNYIAIAVILKDWQSKLGNIDVSGYQDYLDGASSALIKTNPTLKSEIEKAFKIASDIFAEISAAKSETEDEDTGDIVEYKPKSALLKDNVDKQVLFNGVLGSLINYPHQGGDFAVETENRVYPINANSDQTLNDGGVSTVRVKGSDVFGDPVVAGQIYEIEFVNEGKTEALINGIPYRISRNTKGGVKFLTYRVNDKALFDISKQINGLEKELTELSKQYDKLVIKDPENIQITPLTVSILNLTRKIDLLTNRRDDLLKPNPDVNTRDKNLIQALQSLSSTFDNSKGKDEEDEDLEKMKALEGEVMQAMNDILDEGYPEKFDMLISDPASLTKIDIIRFRAYLEKSQYEFEELRIREAAASKLTTPIEKGIAQLGILLNYIKNLEYTQNGKVKKQQPAETKELQRELQENEDESVIQDAIRRQPGEVPGAKAAPGRKAKDVTELKQAVKRGLTGKTIEELNAILDEENDNISIVDIEEAFENATAETIDEVYADFLSKIQTGEISIGDPNIVTEKYKARKLELGAKVEKNTIEVGTYLIGKKGKFTQIVEVVNINEGEYTIVPLGSEDEIVVSLKTLQTKYKMYSESMDEEDETVDITDETEESAQETPETIADALKDEAVINDAIEKTSKMTRAERRAQMAEENKNCKL